MILRMPGIRITKSVLNLGGGWNTGFATGSRFRPMDIIVNIFLILDMCRPIWNAI